jgi:transcriptional antiterminator NusG
LGDTVRIRSGPFVSFNGTIKGINESQARLLVKVAIYGRDNSITLNFSDVELPDAS